MDKEKLGVLATTQKILYDIITIVSKPENDNKDFKIGCKCKTEIIQDKLYKSLCAIFEDCNFKIVKESDDNKVYIENIVRRERSQSFSEEIEDAKIN
jgi:hypothetical protein